MSCFIVPKEHIDVMCWALATFNYGGEYPKTEITLFHVDGVRDRGAEGFTRASAGRGNRNENIETGLGD